MVYLNRFRPNVKFFDSSQTLFRFEVAQQGGVHQARQQCGPLEAPVGGVSNCVVVPSSVIALLDDMAAPTCDALAVALDQSRSRLFAGSVETRGHQHRMRAGSVVATSFTAPTFETNIHSRLPQVTRRFASCHRPHHLLLNRARRVAGRVPMTHPLQHRQVRSGQVGQYRGHVHVVQGAACLPSTCRGSTIEP